MFHVTEIENQRFYWDSTKPIDISIPIRNDGKQPNCFQAPMYEAFPFRAEGFIGSLKEGGPVNFFNIRMNPHGNGTHTETSAHISRDGITINQALTEFLHPALLVSISPEKKPNGDRVISLEQIKAVIEGKHKGALVIRTRPNRKSKMSKKYSGTNPPYFDKKAMQHIVKSGFDHLLVDLPSVDREQDGGKLAAHKAFWRYPGTSRRHATISEMIFVDNKVKDGLYLLDLQISSFELDVSPSKPILYQLEVRL